MKPQRAFLVVALYTLAWFGAGMVRIFRDQFPFPRGNELIIWFALWFGPSAVFTIWWGYSTLKARLTALQAQAQQAGFEIVSQADENFLSDVASLRLLTSSGSQRCIAVKSQPMPWSSPLSPATRVVFNMMRKEADGARITFFEYTDQPTGLGSRDSTGSVIQFHSAALHLPRFSIGPEGVIDRVAHLLGNRDINIASHPKFSKMFNLRGLDEAEIRAHFSAKILSFYESHPGLYTEGEGNQLVVYGGSKEWFPYRASDERVDYLIKPEVFEEFLRQAQQVYDVFALGRPE